ncbi:hypothetical protein MN608_11182 [Microdochium nivale]|nr:hypothetical protein MN608_11182 [Microdochium nivale]
METGTEGTTKPVSNYFTNTTQGTPTSTKSSKTTNNSARKNKKKGRVPRADVQKQYKQFEKLRSYMSDIDKGLIHVGRTSMLSGRPIHGAIHVYEQEKAEVEDLKSMFKDLEKKYGINLASTDALVGTLPDEFPVGEETYTYETLETVITNLEGNFADHLRVIK